MMDNKTKNIVAIVSIILVTIISLFWAKSCRQDGDLYQLRTEVAKLETELKNMKEKLQNSENALDEQKEYLEMLLKLVKEKKMVLDTFTDEDIQKIANIKSEVSDVSKHYDDFKSYDKSSSISYRDFLNKKMQALKDENKTLQAANLIKDKEIVSKNIIIADQKAIIDKLTSEKTTLEKNLYNNQLINQRLLSHIAKLRGNIALYQTQGRKAAETKEMELLKREEERQRLYQNTLDSLNEILNNKDDSLKRLGKSLPATTSLKITYKNQQGNFVELLGSKNKKSNKNIKEILVNFKLNTSTYGGDIAVQFYLSCTGGNSRKCQERNIINKPITLLSNNMWAECDQRFIISEGLTRDCTYKIQILHGTTSLFGDYIFTTD